MPGTTARVVSVGSTAGSRVGKRKVRAAHIATPPASAVTPPPTATFITRVIFMTVIYERARLRALPKQSAPRGALEARLGESPIGGLALRGGARGRRVARPGRLAAVGHQQHIGGGLLVELEAGRL